MRPQRAIRAYSSFAIILPSGWRLLLSLTTKRQRWLMCWSQRFFCDLVYQGIFTPTKLLNLCQNWCQSCARFWKFKEHEQLHIVHSPMDLSSGLIGHWSIWLPNFVTKDMTIGTSICHIWCALTVPRLMRVQSVRQIFWCWDEKQICRLISCIHRSDTSPIVVISNM